MKAIIIDDERDACDALSSLIGFYCPTVEIVAICNNVESGLNAVRTLKPELVFLDVELKEMLGFEFLENLGFLHLPFEVIFSTGHGHYAIQAIQYSAIGFLIKPVRHLELVNVVMKAQQRLLDKERLAHYEVLKENLISTSNPRMVLSTVDGMYIVPIHEIVRLGSIAQKNLTTFYLTDHRQVIVSKNIGEFDEIRPFLRVHRSESVNPFHIIRVQRNGMIELSDKFSILVSPTKREQLFNWFDEVKPSFFF